MIPPIKHKIFRYHNSSETLPGCSRNFLVLWDLNFSKKKSWWTLLCISFFNTIFFSETLQGCSQNFWDLWDQSFPTEKCDTRLFHPYKLKETRNILKNSRSRLQKFWQVETKDSWQKNVKHPIMPKIFRYPNFSETLNGCPQILSALWDKKLSTKNCDTPIMHKIFRLPQTFWNIEGMPTLFSALSDLTFFDRKTFMPLICKKNYDITIFSNIAWMLNKFFDPVGPNFFNGKIWYPLFNPLKRFETRFSLKNSRIHLQKHSALWDGEFLTEKRDTLCFA